MGNLWVAPCYHPAILQVTRFKLLVLAGGRAMESYVIRIYRRDNEDPKNCAGLAEVIETDEKKAFRNLDELLEILKANGRNPSGKKRSKTINS